jgi:AcrR family transcriptional regulator
MKAADLVLARGVGATSLDDVRAGTATSKSQLFHYFPGGKSELISAIVTFQGERVLNAQRPHLDALNTWDAWEGWRHAVLTYYGSQVHWGCPISALARELIGLDEERAKEAKMYMDRWRGYLYDGVLRMREAGALKSYASPESLSLSTFASLHGGLLLWMGRSNCCILLLRLNVTNAPRTSWSTHSVADCRRIGTPSTVVRLGFESFVSLVS